jgi:hypothetical protein
MPPVGRQAIGASLALNPILCELLYDGPDDAGIRSLVSRNRAAAAAAHHPPGAAASERVLGPVDRDLALIRSVYRTVLPSQAALTAANVPPLFQAAGSE